jgi:argininosuccinate synthase
MALSIHELKGKKLGVCVSGGLDSKTISTKMKELGCNVLCFTADLGQPDEENIEDVREKMAPCGVDTIIVDLKNEMAEACFEVVKYQACYDGGYWNTTGIARAVTTKGLVSKMQENGCDVLSHGATGRGNDQVRFERYVNVIDPKMGVYAPWRDPALLEEFPGRKEMAEYLCAKGIEAFAGGKKRYSTDGNLAGLSHEAEDLESMETPMTIVEPTMGVWPQDAPDAVETVKIRFEKGCAVEINGQSVTPLEAMELANEIGGRNGIGMKHALESRILGTKSRGVYEAPGMELLGRSLEFVYMAILERRALGLFEHLSKFIADQVYDGRYYDPSTRAAKVAIDLMADYATGTVEVGLYKGNIFFQSQTDCAASIYNEEHSSMEASDGLNPVSSQGYLEVKGVEAISLALAGQIETD